MKMVGIRGKRPPIKRGVEKTIKYQAREAGWSIKTSHVILENLNFYPEGSRDIEVFKSVKSRIILESRMENGLRMEGDLLKICSSNLRQ